MANFGKNLGQHIVNIANVEIVNQENVKRIAGMASSVALAAGVGAGVLKGVAKVALTVGKSLL